MGVTVEALDESDSANCEFCSCALPLMMKVEAQLVAGGFKRPTMGRWDVSVVRGDEMVAGSQISCLQISWA